MRSFCARHFAAIWLLFGTFLPLPTAVATEEASASASAAVSLVGQALLAEAEGDAKRRTDYLKNALEADPDCAVAHWQSGEVRLAGNWRSFHDAATETVSSGTVRKYREMRDSAALTVHDQVTLALVRDVGLGK